MVTNEALLSMLLRQEEDLTRLTASYVATEEQYHQHITGVVYETLETAEKSAYTREKNKLEGERVKIVGDVRNATERIKTTKELLGMRSTPSEYSSQPNRSQQYHGRVPSLPKFRNGKDGAITDAYEFIEECKALFEAHLLPAERWHAALLTGLTSVDRHWTAENLKDLDWSSLSNEFVGHFDSPVLKDKLMQDLMSCKMGKKESVQTYCDRFTILMRRTGKHDDDPALVAVFISGLDSKLQETMQVPRATNHTVWRRNNANEEYKESIAWEVHSAISLDAAHWY